VDATKDLVCAYKPNLAFYRGTYGKNVLKNTFDYIKHVAPGVVTILDAKQADIGNTNDGYVQEDFEFYGADAVTVHPYLGQEALKPFLDREDKGVIVLCRTSNPGAGEFQDIVVENNASFRHAEKKVFHQVAINVSTQWNYNNNCALVVGATYPTELGDVRKIVGDLPILIPGIGAQGGDLENTVFAGRDSKNQGMIINSSRGIIFAFSIVKDEHEELVYMPDQFALAARTETQKLHDAITATLAAA
jgi:orotidine-5'-phosphate decarboxylase